MEDFGAQGDMVSGLLSDGFEDITFYTDKKVKGSTTTYYSVNMKDKSTNMLEQLMKLINNFYLEMAGGGAKS